MEKMILGTGIFMLSMMSATLLFSRFITRRAVTVKNKIKK
jgi:hypothetical protein